MKKLIILALVVIGVVLFGAPYVTGKVAEGEALKLVELINQSPLKYGNTEVVTYERGFRSTKSSFRYTPPPLLSSIGGPQDIKFNCDTKHGVTAVVYRCKFIGNEAYTEFVAEKLDGKDPISMTGSASLFGGLEQTFSIDAVRDFQADGSIVNLSRTELTIESNSDFSNHDFSGYTDGLSLLDGTDLVSVGEIRFSGDLNKSASGIYTGDSQFNVASLTSRMGNKTFEVNELVLETNTKENGENIDSSMSLQIKKFLSAATPFENIENINLDVSVNGLNTEAFAEYQSFTQRLQNELLASVESQQEPNVDPAKGAEIVPIIEKMLNTGLGLDTTLSVTLDGEPNRAKFKLALLDAVTLEEMELLAVAPQRMLEKFEIELSASLAKIIVESLGVLSATVGQSPMFEKSSKSYQMDVTLGKEITLNGNTITLEELQMLVMNGAAI